MTLLGKLAETVSGLIGSARSGLDHDASEHAVISNRDVVKEGWLQKRSRNVKEWRRRYCVLTKDCRRGPITRKFSSRVEKIMMEK